MLPPVKPVPTTTSATSPVVVCRLFSLALGLLLAHGSLRAATVEDVRLKMGSRFEITAISSDESAARAAIDAAYDEIDRIESLISSWKTTSATSTVNALAGQGPVPVPRELFNLVRRSLKVSELTAGAFDISFAGAGQLWDFKSAAPRLPEPDKIRSALSVVDYKLIQLDERAGTVDLTRSGMRIGFGAIGKGYAANRAVHVLKELDIDGGVVNAGGDLLAFGRQEDGDPWTVAIADPLHRDKVFAYLEISDTAIVTSGDYESFIEIEGVRYSHILDPRTGFPVRDVRSATVLCPDAELADALATGISVLGPEAGLELLNRLKNIDGIIVDSEGELSFSDNLKSRFIEKEVTE